MIISETLWWWLLHSSFLSSVAYPQADLSIPSIYAFQAGLSATIQCRLMPGRLSQYYSVRWMKNGEPIATSNPHFVLQGYQLHDTFSLTINNIQLSDSSTSYQCIAFLNDPQTTRNDDIVYDQSRGLGNITVRVYGKSLCISTNTCILGH